MKAICRTRPSCCASRMATHGRHFAPRGTLTEWEHYARGLVERPGCGDLEPALTRVVRDAGNMVALVLTTRIAPGTIHLAQVAVHPGRRREGFARQLVDEACRLAQPRAARQATLLVGEKNTAARKLYAIDGLRAARHVHRRDKADLVERSASAAAPLRWGLARACTRAQSPCQGQSPKPSPARPRPCILRRQRVPLTLFTRCVSSRVFLLSLYYYTFVRRYGHGPGVHPIRHS